MKPVSVHDYLWEPSKYAAKEICAVFGDEPFLRADAVRHIRDEVLSAEDAEFSLCRFEGDEVTYKDVYRELHTIAMFGGGKRVVCIDEADSFVSKYRSDLEKYAASPSAQSVLILQMKAFPSNQNLFKKIAETGLLIEAKALLEKDVPGWVTKWSKRRYKTPCNSTAAEMIVQRIGTEHGLLDQELAKLSLMTDEIKGITTELVEQTVGAWRLRTAFEMLDLVLDGKTAAAVHQLDVLVAAGENAVGILAQISASLRKLAAATELYIEAERQNRRITPKSALEKAGINKYYLNKTEKQFIQLGRQRGQKLSQWLLQLDLDLKGNSRTDPRVLLEMFIVKLSAAKLR